MSGLDAFATSHALGLRDRWVRDRPVLYHGTRYFNAIRATDTLRRAPFGDLCVSMTRRPEVACYVAMSDRDDDEGLGAVLVLDRQKLQARYQIDVRHCACWDGCGHGPDPWMFDEAEEAIWQDIVRLRRYLIDIVYIDEVLPAVQVAA